MGRGAHAPPIGPRCASTGQHPTPTAQLTRSFMSTGCLTPPINTGSRDSTDFASNSRSPHARNPQKPRNTGVLLSLPATNAGASHAVLVGNQAQRPWAWTPHDPQTPASPPQPNAPVHHTLSNPTSPQRPRATSPDITHSRVRERWRTTAQSPSPTPPSNPPHLGATNHEKQKGGRHRHAMVPPTHCVRNGSRKAQASLRATSSSASPRWI